MSETFDPYYTWLGIPPQQQPPNHYRLLGVELFESNPEVIERAADRCMADLRTHQSGKHSADSQRLLNEVAAARLCLLDPKKKAEYDASLREKHAARQDGAIEEDVFTSLAATSLKGGPASAKSAAKPRRSTALIGGSAAAAAAVVLVAAWVFWSGGKTPEEPRGAAMKDGGQKQAAAGLDDNRPAKGDTEKSPSAAATSELPEGPSRKADNPETTKSSEAAGAARQVPPPPSESQPAKAPTPAAAPPPPGPASPAPAEEAKKHPIPSAETQRDVGRTIEETYKSADARTPEEKVKLAKELSEASKKSTKPEEQYVLLRKAIDLACDGGDAALMLETLGPMTDAFAIDALVAKATMLERFAKGPRSPARVQSLVESSRGVIDDAMAEDRYEIASNLAKAVADASSRSSPQVRKEAADRRRRVVQAQKQYEEVQKALEALKANAEDADANLKVGTWYCFVKDDWQTGLPHLAKGSDELLKSLAQREAASPRTSAEEQLKLADAWWDGAAERRGEEKGAMLRCAGYWYEQAIGKLDGVNKTKAEKRLAQIAELGQEPSVRAGREPPRAIAPFDAKRAQWFQVHWARYLKVPVEFTNSIGMKFVLIPPGEFDMGSPKELIAEESRVHAANGPYVERLLGEAPRHRVRVTKPFWLAVTEVTQEEYQRVMGNNPSLFQGDPKRPVEQVFWDDASQFCRRLSELPEEKGAKRLYALPTEAQWEYACRAGNAGPRFYSPQPNALPGGAEEKLLGECAWFAGNAGGVTHPVGQKRPNVWGLYDMYGNVFEWCQDWHERDYYAKSPSEDPAGPRAASFHVFRGGSWDGSAGMCRSAYRCFDPQQPRTCGTGFRVCCMLMPQSTEETRRPATVRGASDSAGPQAPPHLLPSPRSEPSEPACSNSSGPDT